MDWLYSIDWLTDYKLPIGKWAKQIFTWLNDNGGPVFEFLRFIMQSVIDGCLFVLTETPPLLIIAAFLGLTWYLQRSWKTVALVALSFLFILNQGYWDETMQSMTLILLSCVTCMGFGVPLGIMAAHRPRFYRAVSPVLDMMQTLPTFVYLIPAIVFFGIGMVPGLIATVIFVLPAPIRLTHLGVSSTPTALLEAATAFGATPSQRLWKVELPWALPQIMVGLTQSIMLSLSMVVIATMVGANGLGTPVVRALGTVDTRLGFESGFIIVVVAIMLDRMLKVTRA
ncbi:choline ABC transporter permease subunit [Gemmobacter lanyuensis]|uniref:Choline ABC transporter permease subunit n=1 Tax=Gemmobacter lanyuensis TaxID=1054497 RepID=A0A918MME7_9RHOB|nr:choline ABC transporter permease subunit [Gemmobacter lanyuensis]GGW36182.1 choline ABC transporter permease subunit [Gemmobacter lanyuensis]